MEWTVSNPHESVVSPITGDTTLYTVHILHVPKEDSILEGFVEFWRRILSEGPGFWTGCPDKLWFQFWTDSAMVTAVFTSKDYHHEQPGVYKLISELISEDYDRLPDPDDDGDASSDDNSRQLQTGDLQMAEVNAGEALNMSDYFEVAHDELMQKYWTLFIQAASTDTIQMLLNKARADCSFELMGTYCAFLDEAVEIDI